MDNHSKWSFEAPKYWDLTGKINQDRPNDSWFKTSNISAASFGAPRKRRALRVMTFAHKPTKSKPIRLPDESVFDRLARESTISFSNKIVHTEPDWTAATKRSPTEYPEMRRLSRKSITPNIHKNHIKQKVASFFSQLIRENVPKRNALMEKRKVIINGFFNDLIQRNKSLYENKQIENVEQQVIAVKYFDQKQQSTGRKRSMSSTVDNYKRAKIELRNSKERTSFLIP